MADPGLRVLLLDLDNTLFDRDGAFARWAAELLGRAGVEAATDPSRRILLDMHREDRRGGRDREDFCAALSRLHPEVFPDPSALVSEHRRIAEFSRPTPGVVDMLGRLSATWSLRLVSNGSGAIQRRKLTLAGLDGVFSQIWISGEQGMEKPQAAFFLRALGDASPDAAVMVGDDPDRDILPARALGMRTVHIDPSHRTPQPLPHGRIGHILQLEEILA